MQLLVKLTGLIFQQKSKLDQQYQVKDQIDLLRIIIILQKDQEGSRFKSLIIEKDFEPENPKQLEELDENSCKWPIGHPNEPNFYFCGRSSLKDFSYCKLHILYAYQPKGKKEDVVEKDEDVVVIGKKIQSA